MITLVDTNGERCSCFVPRAWVARFESCGWDVQPYADGALVWWEHDERPRWPEGWKR